MTARTVTLDLPENLYLRLQQTANATRQTVEAVLLRAVQVGRPPAWETAPPEFQADLARMDHLDDDSLWQIARGRRTEADMEYYQELLDRNANGVITADERDKLAHLRFEFDREMLQKVHAAALLRWRGHRVPIEDDLTDSA